MPKISPIYRLAVVVGHEMQGTVSGRVLPVFR